MTQTLARAGIAVLAMFAVLPAFADAGAATACAAGLSPAAKAIYDAAAPEFASAADPRALVKAKTIDLVKAGTVKTERRLGGGHGGGRLPQEAALSADPVSPQSHLRSPA